VETPDCIKLVRRPRASVAWLEFHPDASAAVSRVIFSIDAVFVEICKISQLKNAL
jgi:hypothetical protein